MSYVVSFDSITRRDWRVVELRNTGTCSILTQDAIYMTRVGIILFEIHQRDLRSLNGGFESSGLPWPLSTEDRPFYWCTKLEATSTALWHDDDDTIRASTQANCSSDVEE